MTHDKTNAPAEWAKERVCELADNEPGALAGCWVVEKIGPGGLASAFARYIEQHEDPPFDPLRLQARKVVADHYGYGNPEEVSIHCAEVEFVMKGIELAKDARHD